MQFSKEKEEKNNGIIITKVKIIEGLNNQYITPIENIIADRIK